MIPTRYRHPALIVTACISLSPAAMAHGIVGERFFPATIATDDPFAADELALPTISQFRHLDDGRPVTETGYEMEYSKSILPGLAVSFEGGYVRSAPEGGASASGFENIELTPIVEVFRSPEHEFIVSAAFDWEIGGTGSRHISESASSFTPELEFGKGFGDLPESAGWLRPFAVTGTLGYEIPGHGGDPHVFGWGGAIEYSLLYLQTNVRDVGLDPVISHMTPVVEFSMESSADHQGGATTGTINPGLIWSGQKIQLGVEAMIPVNRATGSNVGVIAQLHFYVDDIFPHSLGAPLFK